MNTFEDHIRTRLSVAKSGSNEPPEVDLDYFSRPENYAGSNLQTMQRVLYAKKKFTQMLHKEYDDKQSYTSKDGYSNNIHSLKVPELTYLATPYQDLSFDKLPSETSTSQIDLSSETNSSHVFPQNTDLKKENNHPHILVQGQGQSRPVSRISICSTDDLISNKSLPTEMGRMSPRGSITGSLKLHRRRSMSLIAREEGKCTEDQWSQGKSSLRSRTSTVSFSSSKRTGTIQLSAEQTNQAKERFRHAIRTVLIVLKWISSLGEKGDTDRGEGGRTFTDIASDAFSSDELKNSGLSFDLSYYKAKKEINISNEVKHILSIPSAQRTHEQLQLALFGLQHLKSFAEYPLHMQEKLCQVAWFQQVPPKRVIIRQGHYAENFYFILSGQAVVRILEKNPKTGEPQLRTATIMRKGTSFGELALLHHSVRTATVVSQDVLQLLAIGRDDFFDIFMSGQGPDDIPHHVHFVSQLDFMKDWPIQRLIDRPECCLFHFFKRGVVIVRDSSQSDWLYIVKSGSCTVMKELKGVIPKLGYRSLNGSPRLKLPKYFMGEEIVSKVDCGRRSCRRVRTAAPIRQARQELVQSSQNLAADGDEEENLKGTLASIHQTAEDKEKRSQRSRSRLQPLSSSSCPGFSRSRLHKFPRVKKAHFASSRTGSRPRSQSPPVKTRLSRQAGQAWEGENETPLQYKGPVFVQVDVLKPKDTFGLTTIKFDDDILMPQTTVSLVSNGAECIMLSKKFFMEHANVRVRQSLRQMTRTYPSEESLQENLQIKVDWELYRKRLLRDTMAAKT